MTALRVAEPHEPRYRFYGITELDHLPRQEWLIADVLPAEGMIALIGPKGCFKTFAALDLALHLAHGLEWHSHSVRYAPVAYVYSEGAFGVRERVNAWLSFYSSAGLRMPREEIPIKFLPTRV